MSLRNLQLSSAITNSLGSVTYQDVTDMLPKNPKNTWAQLAGVRNVEELTTIVLHHDAYPKKNTINQSDMQLMTKIANEHINNRAYDATGEGGLPYHLFIRNGRVYQGNDILDRTYGVGSHNGYTVHIVVSGDYFNFDVLTDADRKALYAAILMVIDVLPNYQIIKAHSDLNPTNCPGYDYRQVVADIKNLQMKIARDKTMEAQIERCFAVYNQATFMYNQAKLNDGNGVWARSWLDEVHSIMKDKNLL